MWACADSALACADLPAADAQALSLAKAVSRVADCHPDVRAARAAVSGAVADQQIAGQRPNPQLTLGAGSVGRSLGSGSVWNKTFDHSLRLDQLFERGGKPGLRESVAAAAHRAVVADLAEAQRLALLAVVRAHQDLWAAQGRRVQLAAAAGLSADSLRALQQRVSAGDAPALDATRFGLDDVRLQADLRQADADIASLRRQLATLIGAVVQAEQLHPLAAPLVFPLVTSVNDADAVQRRPDVSAALARVDAAEQARDLAAAARTRDVSVGLQLDRWPTSPANGSGTGNTVSVNLTVPLFLHHNNGGEVARAEADLNMAREAWRRISGVASADLARARVQAQAAQDRHRLVAEHLLPAAGKVSAGAELAYQRGASSALEVLDSRRSLRAVRMEVISAEAELAKALAELRAAVQTADLNANP